MIATATDVDRIDPRSGGLDSGGPIERANHSLQVAGQHV